MNAWKGIVGRGFSPVEFQAYVEQLAWGAWRPSFVVLHNTSEPRLSQWHSTPGEQRMLNLQDYYRNQEGWSAGPHLFVADDKIWVFTPLTVSGVHSPSWNTISWGVEMVGEYDEEDFSPAVRENAIDALAVMHAAVGLDPNGLRFHKEDPLTTHRDCPGKNVSKPDIIKRVLDRLASFHEGEHAANDMTQAAVMGAGLAAGSGNAPVPSVAVPVLESNFFKGNDVLEAVAEGHLVLRASGDPVDGIGPVQDALNELGLTVNLGANDQFRGYFGEKTEGALEQFQKSHGIVDVNGEVDAETIMLLDKAVLAQAVGIPAPAATAGGLPRRLPGYAMGELSAAEGVPWNLAVLKADFNNYVGLMPDTLCLFEKLKLVENVSSAVIYECKLAIDSDGSAPAGDISHQNRTSLRHTDADSSSLNATIDSFAVLPMDRAEAEAEGFVKLQNVPDFGSLGLKLGDVGVAFWKDAPGVVPFVYGDEGPPNALGEGSILMAKSLKIDADPSNGGFNAKDIRDMDAGVVHIAFPGSTDVAMYNGYPSTNRTPREVDELARALFAAFRAQPK